MQLERLAVNAIVATVLGSIPESSDTVESEEQRCEAQKKMQLIFLTTATTVIEINVHEVIRADTGVPGFCTSSQLFIPAKHTC